MSRKHIAIWLSTLALVGAAVYAVGWNNPFVLDAANKIENNPDVRSHNFRWQTFFDAYSAEQAKGTHLRNDPSRPVTYFCYWVLWQIGGGESWPFHVFATLLHVLSSFLLGLLALKLLGNRNAAIASSFLFLVLPLNAGTVLYPFALSDVLATTLTLFVLNSASVPLAAAAFVLALGAKQSAVVIPVLMFFVNRDRKMLSVLGVLTAAYLVLRLFWFGGIGDLEAEAVYPRWDYFQTQGVMIWKYLALLIWPAGLSLDHAVKPMDYSIAVKILAWVVIVALCFRKRNLVPLVLFLVPLLPTSSFMPTTDLFVERRAYLSSAGVILAFTTALSTWKYFAPLAAVAVIAYGAVSANRASKMSSPEYVYQEVLNLYPNDQRSMGNLAMLYLQKGQFSKAKEQLEATLKLGENNVDALANLAALYQIPESGFFSPPQAQMLYQRVLQLDPNHLNALRNLGFLQLTLKRTADAKIYFQKVLSLNPRSSMAMAGMGKAESIDGNIPVAVRWFEDALAEEPGQSFALLELQKIQGTH